MKTKQQGFTLIELVVVIVLLGIVGAAATARFQDLANDARLTTAQAITAEIQSGSAINYAKSLVGTPDVNVTSGQACLATVNALLTVALDPAIWTVSAGNIAAGCTPGTSTTSCTLNDFGNTIGGAIPITLICN